MKSALLGLPTRKHQILVQDWAEEGLTFKSYERWSQIVVMAQLEILLDQKRDKYPDLVPDFKVDLIKDPVVQLEEFTSELFKDTASAIYDFHKLHEYYVTSQRRIMTEHPFLNIANQAVLVDVMKTVLYVTRFIRAKLPRNHPLKPILTINNPFSYLSSGYKLSIIAAQERLKREGVKFVTIDPLKLTKDELSSHISNCLRDSKTSHWEIKKTEDLEFEKITGLPMNFVYKRLKTTTIFASN